MRLCHKQLSAPKHSNITVSYWYITIFLLTPVRLLLKSLPLSLIENFYPLIIFLWAYFTLKFIILKFPSQSFNKVKQNIICSLARYALKLEIGKWQMCLFLQKQKINFKSLLEVIWLKSTAFGLHLLSWIKNKNTLINQGLSRDRAKSGKYYLHHSVTFYLLLRTEILLEMHRLQS